MDFGIGTTRHKLTLGISRVNLMVNRNPCLEQLALIHFTTTSKQKFFVIRQGCAFVVCTKVLDETSRVMPDLGAALERHLLDESGVMKEPVSGEALILAEAAGRNLIIDVLVSREGVDRVTRISETFRLRVDSVRDTETDRWLTLDSAVDAGVIVPSHGEYVDRRRGIHMPLIDAVRDSLIQGRLLDVERKKEEVARTAYESGVRVVDGRFSSMRSSHGATSSLVSSEDLPRSINVQGIVDPRTGLELSVKDAVDMGLFDPSTGEFIDTRTGERLSLERAIALGLVIADQDKQVDEMVVQQTYNIGAVHDPVSGRLILPSEAVQRGLLDMARGIYFNPLTHDVLTLAEAFECGLIRAEPLKGDSEMLELAAKSVVASKVQHDRMTFTIKSVKDLSTGELIHPDEAVKRGILDAVSGLYIDRMGKKMSLHEAYEAGLIEAVETEQPVPSSTMSLERRSFQIVAVIDPHSGEQLTVAEAVDRHLLDAALTQFVDLYNDEVMSVEEAIRRGYVIADYGTAAPGPAAVIHDVQSYRIKSVIDPRTGEEIPIADAVRHKLVDKTSGTYWNMKTDEMIPIDEAIHLGLIITEPVDAAVTKTAQLEIGDDFQKQMYLLTAVRDPKTGKEYDPVEAERRGLVNKLQGVYINPVTGEKIPIRTAIERGLISGSVIGEGDYDDLPPGAYITSETTIPLKTSDRTGASREQVVASSLSDLWVFVQYLLTSLCYKAY